ncbi:MAG TPA: hypothetical protein VGP33_03475 [Chloroflexota bacterium]|jgi:hypothetical protein|nr:hypothetical protein [Chloroflexota bacterium]
MSDTASKSSSRKTVMVGCKLPNGLRLQLRKKLADAPAGGIGSVYQPVGDPVTLAGRNSSRVIGGYGLTEVDADFMAEWMKQNEGYSPIVKGMIFVQSTPDRAADQAKEQEAVKGVSEPMSQTAPGIKPAE